MKKMGIWVLFPKVFDKSVYSEFDREGKLILEVHLGERGDTLLRTVYEYPSEMNFKIIYHESENTRTEEYFLAGEFINGSQKGVLKEGDSYFNLTYFYDSENRVIKVMSLDELGEVNGAVVLDYTSNGDLKRRSYGDNPYALSYEYKEFDAINNWLIAYEMQESAEESTVNIRTINYHNDYSTKSIKPSQRTAEALFELLKNIGQQKDRVSLDKLVHPNGFDDYLLTMKEREFQIWNMLSSMERLDVAFIMGQFALIPVKDSNRIAELHMASKGKRWYIVLGD